MKQSSVEWLANRIDEIIEVYPSERQLLSDAIKQAKAMRKEEIEDAHYDGQIEGFTGIPSKDLAKKYYNETFGQ